MRNFTIGAAVTFLALALTPHAGAFTTAFVDFENNPSIAKGPSLFADAGAAQTIVVPGVAMFTGGVVLGDATNLPAQSFGTPPNVYGTAVASATLGTQGASSTLLPTVTISIDPGYTVNEISFPLFNGVTTVESYTVTAFDGATQIGQQQLNDLPSNTDSGRGVIDLKAADMTSVTIVPGDTSLWDYFIDSVAFNEPVSAAITPNGTPIPPPSAVPLPPTVWSAGAVLGVLGAASLIRSRRQNAAA